MWGFLVKAKFGWWNFHQEDLLIEVFTSKTESRSFTYCVIVHLLAFISLSISFCSISFLNQVFILEYELIFVSRSLAPPFWKNLFIHFYHDYLKYFIESTEEYPVVQFEALFPKLLLLLQQHTLLNFHLLQRLIETFN